MWPPGALTHQELVHVEVVGLAEILLVVSVVQALAGGVVLQLPPLPIVHVLTEPPKKRRVVNVLSPFLCQDVVSWKEVASRKLVKMSIALVLFPHSLSQALLTVQVIYAQVC